jgi:hypothetical protein
MSEICKGCGTGDLVCKSCGATRAPDGETRYDGPPPEFKNKPAEPETPATPETPETPAVTPPPPARDERTTILEYL